MMFDVAMKTGELVFGLFRQFVVHVLVGRDGLGVERNMSGSASLIRRFATSC